LKPTLHKSLLSLNICNIRKQKPNFQEIIISVSWKISTKTLNENGLKKLSSAGQGDEKPEKIVEQHFIISNIFGFIILSPYISKKILKKSSRSQKEKLSVTITN